MTVAMGTKPDNQRVPILEYASMRFVFVCHRAAALPITIEATDYTAIKSGDMDSSPLLPSAEPGKYPISKTRRIKAIAASSLTKQLPRNM